MRSVVALALAVLGLWMLGKTTEVQPAYVGPLGAAGVLTILAALVLALRGGYWRRGNGG